MENSIAPATKALDAYAFGGILSGKYVYSKELDALEVATCAFTQVVAAVNADATKAAHDGANHGDLTGVCTNKGPHLPVLPIELWILIFGFLDETSKAVARHVCREWRGLVMVTTRGIIPRIFAEDLACSISLLKWQRNVLHRPFTEHTSRHAVFYKKPDILRYLRANRCPFTSLALCIAIRNNNFEIFKYAYENGFPYDELTVYLTLHYNHLDMFEYALQNGFPYY